MRSNLEYVTKADAEIIRRHYGLKRALTDDEVRAEFEMLRRRAENGALLDSQIRLAGELGLI